MSSLRLLIAGAGILAGFAASGCGGGDDLECGPGTTEQDGQCVAGTPVECAAGTVLVDNACVPDGSVVCDQGTVFDPATGTCVLDPSACAAGTVLIGDECVPEDEALPSMADHQEGAEPNGFGGDNVAGLFTTPALDASTTFYGCVTATDDENGDGNLDADYDVWMIEADGPMVLDITADGIGGLSAGFIALNADLALSPVLDNWERLGINLTGDTAERELFLPAAGTYALVLTDGRSLFLGSAGAGTEDTCYFTTVTHVATPLAVPLTLPQTVATDTGHVQLFTYTATAEGDILDVTENTVAPAMSPAFVTLRNGTLQGSSTVIPGAFGDTPPLGTVGGLAAGDVITLVADAEYNYGLSPQEFAFDLFQIGSQALPVGGGVITLTENNGVSGAGYADLNYSYFDVATPSLVHFDLVASKPVDMAILRRDVFTPAGAFDYVASIDAFGSTGRGTFQGEFVRFLAAGRYYFVTQNPAATTSGGTYTVTATLTTTATTPLALGTPVTGVALARGNSFHTLDLTDPVWIEYGITATTDWGGSTVSIESYDLALGGWLRSGTASGTIPAGNVYPLFTGTQPSAAPFAPQGRIVANETRDFLVRVKPSGTPGAAPTYSLLPQNRQNVTVIESDPATPFATTIAALANGAPRRFIALGTAGNNLRALAHPTQLTVDIRELRLNANEGTAATFNATGLGGDETLTGLFSAAQPWVAWSVENTTPAITSDVNLTVTEVEPRPYVITNGTLAWSDACTGGGTTLGTNQDDQLFTAQTLPPAFSAFQLFGEAVPSTFRIGANGWISWDTGTVTFGAFNNQPIPSSGAPEGLVGPFWQDLDTVTLCRKDTADTVTIQWTGNVYQAGPTQAVQFQLVLHANSVVDFIYGPSHISNGAFDDGDGDGATVGAENLSGTFGHQVHFNTPSVMANTSRTLTPM